MRPRSADAAAEAARQGLASLLVDLLRHLRFYTAFDWCMSAVGRCRHSNVVTLETFSRECVAALRQQLCNDCSQYGAVDSMQCVGDKLFYWEKKIFMLVYRFAYRYLTRSIFTSYDSESWYCWPGLIAWYVLHANVATSVVRCPSGGHISKTK